jgi:hypothetical protein
MDMNDNSLDKLIREKIREQENLYPSRWPEPDVLWRSLNERRGLQAKRRKGLWQIAAAVLIIMMAGYTFFLHNRPGKTISRDLSPTTLSVKAQDAVDFIARYCAGKNMACNTPVMLELRGDLEQSFRKLEEIDNQLKVYRNDIELIRAKSRIESHQARLIKAIVQTL